MKTLTDKQFEAVAREYCRLRGLDPDSERMVDMSPAPRAGVANLVLTSRLMKQWELFSGEVVAAHAMQQAIENVTAERQEAIRDEIHRMNDPQNWPG